MNWGRLSCYYAYMEHYNATLSEKYELHKVLSRPLSFYLVDAWTSYKFVLKNNHGQLDLSFKEMCQRMCCLVICCNKYTSIAGMPLTEKKNNKTVDKKNHHKKIYQLLEKLYYEWQRPSALGGVEKLYRAARHYGLKRSQQ